ncbi:MAG: hypothetical protein QXI38_02100 [Conexivisphaerales archaeon]
MPLHIKADHDSVAKMVIASGNIDIVKQLSELFQGRLVNDNRGFFLYTGSYDGVPVSAIYHGIGGASESIAFEELAQLGVKKIITLENAILSYKKGFNAMISSSASYSEGGTIGEYVTSQKVVLSAVPSFKLLMGLDIAFTKHKVKHIIGPTLTVDVLNYKKPGKLKFICAEMHCAVLYALSQIRGFESACVIIPNSGKNLTKKIITDIESSVSDALIAD